jgi:hypothetical protein
MDFFLKKSNDLFIIMHTRAKNLKSNKDYK